MARSWSRGQVSAPHQPMPAHIEAAKHLRLMVSRYIDDRASLADIDEAMLMLRRVAPVHGERGYRSGSKDGAR